MARDFRAQLRRNSKGQVFYQIMGPNPETGKEEYKETIKGSNAKKRADARIRELTHDAFALTETGKRETRRVSDLADAFVRCKQEHYRENLASEQWYRKGRRCGAETKYGYERWLDRFIIGQEVGDIILIALTFERLEAEIKKVEREFGAATAHAFGVKFKAMIRWGAKRGWTVRPLLLILLSDVCLPARAKRKHYPKLEAVRKVLAAVMGPRGDQEERRHYLNNRVIHLISIANGSRISELGYIRWKHVDLDRAMIQVWGQFSRLDKHFKPATKTPSGLDRPIWLCRQTVEVLRFMKERYPSRPDDLMLQGKEGGGQGLSSTTINNNYIRATQRRTGLTEEEMAALIRMG